MRLLSVAGSKLTVGFWYYTGPPRKGGSFFAANTLYFLCISVSSVAINMHTYNTQTYPLQPLTYQLIGIGMEIHRLLGKGFLEIVYKDAFEYELNTRGILYEREKEYAVTYKNIILPHKFFADFVIENCIILEIKSKAGIIEQHQAQVLNYLAVSRLKLGLLLNFHEKSLQYNRIIL